jgi:peptide/nickel transport system substrate-binding protein
MEPLVTGRRSTRRIREMSHRKRRGTAAWPTLLLALTLVGAACSSAGEETTTTTAAPAATTTTVAAGETTTTAAPTESASGGILTVALPQDPTKFDPYERRGEALSVMRSFYDTLIEYDADFQPLPWIATEWDVSDDSQTVTLTLRDDVVFHSGRPLTATDIAANFEKAKDPERGFSMVGPFGVLDSWNVVDDYTIELTLTQPTPLGIITDMLSGLPIVDPEFMDSLETNPQGTGPFVFGSYEPGIQITVERNDQYWRDNEPYLDGIEFRIFADAEATIAALETGAVDVVSPVTFADAPRLEDGGFSLGSVPAPTVWYIRINHTAPPFDNATFRQALHYAINREAIINNVLFGFSEETVTQWVPGSPGFSQELNDQYAFDIDRAAELIEEAGLTPEEAGFTLMVSSLPQAGQIGLIIQAEMARIGVNVEVDVNEVAVYRDLLAAGDFQASIGAGGGGALFPTAISTNSDFRIAGNQTLGDNVYPEYVEAIERLNSAFDEAEVAAAIANLQQVFMELGMGPSCCTFDRGLYAAAPNVEGITFDSGNHTSYRETRFTD